MWLEINRLLKRPLFKTFLVWIGAVYLFLTLVIMVPKNWPSDLKDIDASIYYGAAHKAGAGLPLYVAKPEYGPDQRPFEYLYLPPFAAAISPLSTWSPQAFARLWVGYQLFCYLLFPVTLVLLTGCRIDARRYIIAFLVLALVPGSYRAVALGQVDAMIWLAFSLAMLAWLREGRLARSLCGVLLTLSGLLKIYLIWTYLSLSLRNRFVALAGAATIGIGLIFGAVICGPASYLQWLAIVPPQINQGTFNSDNVSFSMAVLRVARLLGWEYSGGPLLGAPVLWLKTATFAGPATALWLTRKYSNVTAAAWCGVIAAWCGPICWTSYLPLFLVPLALTYREKSSSL